MCKVMLRVLATHYNNFKTCCLGTAGAFVYVCLFEWHKRHRMCVRVQENEQMCMGQIVSLGTSETVSFISQHHVTEDRPAL